MSLNDHPHDGIRPHEEMYAAFMADMGADPAHPLLFDLGDRKYMETFFKHAHHASEDMGADFWWLDWQQNYLYPEVRGYRSTSLQWINELYYRQTERKGLRGAGYSRWAGWGDHRHPIQFSGDAQANWEMLAFEVKLTAASGNAGCYYWAHDIGGFRGDPNPELTVRWTQFGALSAALRVHSTRTRGSTAVRGSAESAKRPPMRRMYHMRSELMPYIYSSVWQTHSTMVPLNRPMYIDYGSDERAYENEQEFLFGDILLAAPIASPGEGAGQDSLAEGLVPGRRRVVRLFHPRTVRWRAGMPHRQAARRVPALRPGRLGAADAALYAAPRFDAVHDARPARLSLGGRCRQYLYALRGRRLSRDYERGIHATTQLNYRRAAM